MEKKEKKKRLSSQHTIKNTIYILKLVWGISPWRVIATLLSYLFGFGSWVFGTVVFMRYIFGSKEMNRSYEQVAIFIAFSLLGWMLIAIYEAYFTRYKLINDQLMYRELNRRLFDKATNVDIACYENAEFYNSYTKAASEVLNRAISSIDSISRLISSLLSSLFVVYTMFTINLWVGLVSLLPVVTNLTLGKLGGRQTYEKDMETVPYTRRQDYVNRVFYLQKFAKEIRLTNATRLLEKIYDDATDKTIKVAKKYWKRLFVTNSIKTTLCFPLLFEGTWLLGVYLAMVQKTITTSDFVVVASAAVSTTWMLVSLTESLVTIYSNALYIDNLKTFLNYKERIPENQQGIPTPNRVETLELKNVSFRYEGTDCDVLRDISMMLHRGELISLVGHNGSGKSTLVKLLMRLYDPTEGNIYLNGVDIRKYNLAAYRKLIGSTFQDFQLFSMSVSDNVLMGNTCIGAKRQAVLEALKKSGISEKIAFLPNKEDSILTREFDDEGVNLSVGEAQKVAIARAFAKKSSILILDEPSSALDPVAEYQLYYNFFTLCRGREGLRKISVFISHRLSSAAVADRVYLLEDGRLTEQGTHEQLMELAGTYCGMFHRQAENYLLEEDGI
jgi:ATP-binding cassette, subfamily B, bacterial